MLVFVLVSAWLEELLLPLLPPLEDETGRRFDEVDDDEGLEDDFFFEDELPLLLCFAEEDLLFDVFSPDDFPSFPSFASLAGDILRLKALGLLVVTLVSTSPLVLFFLLAE